MPNPFRSLFVVKGDSMNPALRHGDLILIAPNPGSRHSYRRGAVVAARISAPGAGQAIAVSVKRVVGLPGEYVRIERDGSVWVQDRLLDEPYLDPGSPRAQQTNLSWLCADDEYILMGDNRTDSWDSRSIGAVAASSIMGAVRLKLPTHLLSARRRRTRPEPIHGDHS